MGRERPEGLSRRGLLDVFGRGLKRLREDLDGPPAGSADGATEPRPSDGMRRVLRPADERIAAAPAAPGTWEVPLAGRAFPAGTSVLVEGGGLPEAVVLVRVHPTHLAACTAECPADGSELEWSESADRLVCPGCGSLWRLDGEPMQGPARGRLGTLIVDAYVDDAGGLEIRIQAP